MKQLSILLLLILLSACAGKQTEAPSSAETDFDKGKRMIDGNDYNGASVHFEQFAIHHPFSPFTTRSEVLRIYAAYKGGEYPSAETLSERFMQRHPRHPEVDYVKYIMAMSYYRESSAVGKDQSNTRKAILAFEQLLKDHPQSNYYKESKAVLGKLTNRLAAHELNIGRYYYDHGQYVAAANRLQGVVEKYQTTPAIEEALYLLASSYAKLDVRESAKRAAALLRYNYPNSDWSKKAAEFQ